MFKKRKKRKPTSQRYDAPSAGNLKIPSPHFLVRQHTLFVPQIPKTLEKSLAPSAARRHERPNGGLVLCPPAFPRLCAGRPRPTAGARSGSRRRRRPQSLPPGRMIGSTFRVCFTPPVPLLEFILTMWNVVGLGVLICWRFPFPSLLQSRCCCTPRAWLDTRRSKRRSRGQCSH
jgi:hypothetical protein